MWDGLTLSFEPGHTRLTALSRSPLPWTIADPRSFEGERRGLGRVSVSVRGEGVAWRGEGELIAEEKLVGVCAAAGEAAMQAMLTLSTPLMTYASGRRQCQARHTTRWRKTHPHTTPFDCTPLNRLSNTQGPHALSPSALRFPPTASLLTSHLPSLVPSTSSSTSTSTFSRPLLQHANPQPTPSSIRPGLPYQPNPTRHDWNADPDAQ